MEYIAGRHKERASSSYSDGTREGDVSGPHWGVENLSLKGRRGTQ